MTPRIWLFSHTGAAPRSLAARLAWMALVGGLATGLYAALAFAAVHGLGLPVALASPAAYGLAAIWSYHGHRRLTFAARKAGAGAAKRFSVTALAGYAASCAVPAALTGLGYGSGAAILATCLAIPALNYLALSRIVFADASSRAPSSARRPGADPLRG